MSHSEKRGQILPIRGPELKSESLPILGFITNILAQRGDGCDEAGGHDRR
jgi:hypothetical protein